MDKRSGNYTFDPMFGDDLLKLGSSINCMSPPKAELHPNIGKKITTSMLLDP
jgi:hypothetical protein